MGERDLMEKMKCAVVADGEVVAASRVGEDPTEAGSAKPGGSTMRMLTTGRCLRCFAPRRSRLGATSRYLLLGVAETHYLKMGHGYLAAARSKIVS